MTGGGTGNSPATTSYVPFGGGGGTGFGAAMRSASPGALAGVILGFVGVVFGAVMTLA